MIKNIIFYLLIIVSFKTIRAQCPPTTALAFTVSTSTSNCAANGNITVNVTGGGSPFIYELTGPVNRTAQSSNVFNATPSGNYIIKVTDDCGTTLTNSAQVGGNYVNPTINLTSTYVSCVGDNDGSISINVNGGKPPFNYELINPSVVVRPAQLTNTFLNLPEGGYTIRVSDSCSNIITQNFTLTTDPNKGIPNLNGSNTSKISCDSILVQSNVTSLPSGSNPSGQYQFFLFENTTLIEGPNLQPSFIAEYGKNYKIKVIDECNVEDEITTFSLPQPDISVTKGCDDWLTTFSPDNLKEPITYQITNGPNGPGVPQLNDTFLIADPGVYTYSITDSCGTTINVNQSYVTTQPFALSLGPIRPSCDTSLVSIQFFVTGASYPATLSFLNSPSIFPYNSITRSSSSFIRPNSLDGEYTVAITDACNNTDTINFTSDNSYYSSLSFDVQNNCNASNITNMTLNDNLNLAGGDVYEIIEGPITFPEQSLNEFNNLVSGEYIIRSRPAACNSPSFNGFTYDTILVAGYEPLELTTFGTLCNGSNQGQILAEANFGKPPYSYEILSGPSSSTPLQNTGTFNNLPAGTYQVRSIDSCGNSDVTGIELSPYGLNNISSNLFSCDSSLVTVTADSLPNATYNWTGPNGFTSSNRKFEIYPFTFNDTGTYSVLIQFNTCIDTTIVLNLQPLPFFDPEFESTDICINGTNTVTILGDTGGTFAFDPLPSGSASINNSSGVISNSSVNTNYTIKYSVGSGVCEATSTQEVSVTEIIANELVKHVSCNGENNGLIVLNPSGSNLNNYNYLWADGSINDSLNNLVAGTYAYSIDDGNCTINDSIQINQPQSLSALGSSQSVSCSGETDGTVSAIVSGGTEPYTYLWDVQTLNQDSSTAINLSEGTYSVQITDSNNCSLTLQVTLNEPGPLSVVIEVTDTSICKGDSIFLEVLNPPTNASFTWNTGDTLSSIITSPLLNTEYTVTISNTNCSDSSSQLILVNNLPSLITDTLVRICESDSLFLTASSNATSFVWSEGSTGPSIFISNYDSLPPPYFVTVTDTNGCSATNESNPINIQEFGNPMANFNIDSTSWNNDEFLFEDISEGAISWNWNFGDGNVSDIDKVIHTYDNLGAYDVSLIISDSNNCRDTAYKTIYVNETVDIPNVFSPNKDGMNDYFTIPITGYTSYLLSIKNRWGEIVFETKSDNLTWDGTNKSGQKQSEGTYFYILETKNAMDKIKILNGYITLVR